MALLFKAPTNSKQDYLTNNIAKDITLTKASQNAPVVFTPVSATVHWTALAPVLKPHPKRIFFTHKHTHTRKNGDFGAVSVIESLRSEFTANL